jgi:hypothetical protein
MIPHTGFQATMQYTYSAMCIPLFAFPYKTEKRPHTIQMTVTLTNIHLTYLINEDFLVYQVSQFRTKPYLYRVNKTSL